MLDTNQGSVKVVFKGAVANKERPKAGNTIEVLGEPLSDSLIYLEDYVLFSTNFNIDLFN